MNVWCVFAGNSSGNILLLITSFLLDTGLYIMMLPKPFPADIRPRSASRAEYVRQEWGQMLRRLDAQEQWKAVPESLI